MVQNGFFIYLPNCFLLEPPSSPTALRVRDVTSDSLTIHWEAPEEGPDTVTGYIIEKRAKDTDKWEKEAKLNAKARSHKASKLKAGTYSFRVIAENPAGQSQPAELRVPIEMKVRKGIIIFILI